MFRSKRFASMVAAGALLAGGCTIRDATLPDREAEASVLLRRPSPGDTVAGEVPLEAIVVTGEAIRAVLFRADGCTVAVVPRAPWECAWAPGPAPAGPLASNRSGPLPSNRLLSAEAIFASGRSVRSPAVRVQVLPDSAPAVRIRLPGGALWIERAAGVALIAEAEDFEDGPLAPERIVWRGGGLGRPLTGGHLPLELLPDGDLTLSAEARDRWNLRGSAEVRIHPFRYREGSTIEECLGNLEAAFRAGDPEGWLAQTDSSFRFVPCAGEAEAGGWGAVWPRAEFAARISGLLRAPPVANPEWTWAPVVEAAWAEADGERAWVRCERIECAAETAIRAEASAALLLGRRAGGAWRVSEWRDAPEGAPEDSTASFAALLARAGGLRAGRAACR